MQKYFWYQGSHKLLIQSGDRLNKKLAYYFSGIFTVSTCDQLDKILTS